MSGKEYTSQHHVTIFQNFSVQGERTDAFIDKRRDWANFGAFVEKTFIPTRISRDVATLRYIVELCAAHIQLLEYPLTDLSGIFILVVCCVTCMRCTSCSRFEKFSES